MNTDFLYKRYPNGELDLNPKWALCARRVGYWTISHFWMCFPKTRAKMSLECNRLAHEDILTEAQEKRFQVLVRRLGRMGIYKFTQEQRERQCQLTRDILQKLKAKENQKV